MVWRARIKLFILLLMMSSFQGAYCQVSEEGLPVQDWEELTRDLDYGDIKNLPPEEEEIAEEDSLPWIPKEIMQIIVISLVIIGLTLLLIRIIGGKFATKRIPESNMAFSIDEAEKELATVELNPLLEQFLAEENYRAALRVLYLRCLQKLHRKKLIEWKKEKTNFDYVRELHTEVLKGRFEQLTLRFEENWYGELSLNKEDYLYLEREFGAFDQIEQA